MDQNKETPKVVIEEDERFKRSLQSFEEPTPKIIRWVIKYSGGYVKDENQANYFLIGFVMLAIIVSLFLFFGGRKNDSVNVQKQFQGKIQFLPE